MNKMNNENRPTIIIGVIGSDCHSVGNKILDLFFSENGFNVINLGVLVSQDEFVEAAIEKSDEGFSKREPTTKRHTSLHSE